MLQAKSSFGSFTTNQDIYIAGGTSGSSPEEFALKSVDSYDIQQNVWLR